MKRLWVVSMLSLALAGCAQSRSAISKQDAKPPDPVGLTPVPSVYDTINRGMGGPSIARSAIKNPNEPMWAGRDQATTVARPVSNGPINPGTDPAQLPPSAVASGPNGPIAGQAPPPAGPGPTSTPPAQAAAAVPAASTLAVSELPVQSTPSPVSVLPGSIALEPAGAPVVSPTTAMPGPAPITGPAPLPIQAPRTSSPGLTANGASSATVNQPPINKLPQSSPTADLAVTPSTSQRPLTPAPAGSTKAPARRGDPPLDPSPELMLEMPPLPGEKPSSAESPVPAGPPIELAPASSPPPAQPDSGASTGPEPTGPLSAVDQSAVANKPAPAGKLAAVVALEAAPASSSASPAPEPTALRVAKTRDAQVTRTSFEPAPPRDPIPKNFGKEPGRAVARVGDEIITFHDLILAVQEQLRRNPALNQQIFSSPNPIEVNKHKEMLARGILEGLIERSLLVQEAKHAIKDPKGLDQMIEAADKNWREEHLPPLKRQYSVETEQQLKETFAKAGKSLDQMRLEYRDDSLAQFFLHDRLKDKLNITLPDQLKYYNDHMNDPDFHLPAQITWRELVVEVGRYPSRREAQKKASDLLEKLHRGEDFAKLARAESDGPSRSRQDGGLMETSPGSYAVEAVNSALGTLPFGEVSGILEGPTSLHIVRVENRRPAGPASFEEVRQKIRPLLFEERLKTERAAFISKLRQRTLISSILDEPTRTVQTALQAKSVE